MYTVCMACFAHCCITHAACTGCILDECIAVQYHNNCIQVSHFVVTLHDKLKYLDTDINMHVVHMHMHANH